MARINWIGTGLSSGPGLRRLISSGRDVTVWNRTVKKAKDVVGDPSADVRAFQIEEFESALRPGDVVVSMLPGDWHVPVARRCLDKNAHFVSSSYISPEMLELDGSAKQSGLAFVNETGLDPGIDHLMAHWLVDDYKRSNGFDENNDISFSSYCGGFPKFPNAFRYKFSWSPLGVLKALMSPAKSISEGEPKDTFKPWLAVEKYEAPLPVPELFEAYPNRDSIPFMSQYGFAEEWRVKEFVRGTLRLSGWTDAWSDIFDALDRFRNNPESDELARLAERLWEAHSYGENDPDRVVLCVSLKAERESETKYHKTWVLDAWGDNDESAMGRLVSIPVALAVESVLAGEMPAGVGAPPNDPGLVAKWLDAVGGIAQVMSVKDSLAS